MKCIRKRLTRLEVLYFCLEPPRSRLMFGFTDFCCPADAPCAQDAVDHLAQSVRAPCGTLRGSRSG